MGGWGVGHLDDKECDGDAQGEGGGRQRLKAHCFVDVVALASHHLHARPGSSLSGIKQELGLAIYFKPNTPTKQSRHNNLYIRCERDAGFYHDTGTHILYGEPVRLWAHSLRYGFRDEAIQQCCIPISATMAIRDGRLRSMKW